MPLTPEQQVMYENAKSLLAELEALIAAEDGQEELTTEAIEDENLDSVEPTIESEDEEMEKEYGMEDEDEVEKSEDGSTASDDAEERLEDDLPDATVDQLPALKALVKALGGLNKRSKTVKKSKESKIYKAIEKLAKNQEIQGRALENILDGFGIADTVKKSLPGNQVRKSIPRQVSSQMHSQLIDQIQKNISGIAKTEEKPLTKDEVRKSMRNNLGLFFQ